MTLRTLQGASGALAALVVAIGVLWSSSAMSQEEKTVELSEAQVGYFVKAGEALKSEDFTTAVEYYQLAIKAGEANILYASLGRAQFRLGDCKAADESYVKALSAPAVPDPPPATIRAKIEEYRIGLRVECPGRLEIACEPSDMEIRIGDGARRPCSDFPVDLKPDTYKLLAFAYGVSTDREVKITGMETTSLTLNIDNPKGSDGSGGAKQGESSGMETVGLISMGVGVAVLGTAALLDATTLATAVDDLEVASSQEPINVDKADKALEDAEGLQTVVLGTYVAGAVIALTGVVLYLVAPEEQAPEAGSGLQGWIGPDGAGVQYSLPW